MANHREPVEFTEVSKPNFGEKKKIKLFQSGNGDFYLTVCPYNHNGGDTIRLETSGGAITRNPRLIQATNLMYLAIAGENENFDKQIIKTKIFNNISFSDIIRKTIEVMQSDLTKEEKAEEIESYQNYLAKNFTIK